MQRFKSKNTFAVHKSVIDVKTLVVHTNSLVDFIEYVNAGLNGAV